LDNPDNFTIEPRGDPSLTLAVMITHDIFDKTIHSLGTGKAPGPDGIPNEIIKYLPPAPPSFLSSPSSPTSPTPFLIGAIAQHAAT
jgi:hypothetical protein